MKFIKLFLLFLPFFAAAQPAAVSAGEMPEFTGGDEALYKYLQYRLSYPAGSLQIKMHGYVYAQFVINKDGQVKNIVVAQGISKQLDSIVNSALKTMPNWVAGKNGKSKADVWVAAGFDFQIKDSVNAKPKIKSSDPQPYFTAVIEENNAIFVERKAQFPGGESGLQEYIDKHKKYPAKVMRKGIQGTVFVSFTVDVQGNVTDLKLRNKLDDDLEQEAMHVIETMPKWKPATMNGQPIKSIITAPIHFRIRQEAY